MTDRQGLTNTMTHVEELRKVASLDQCAWDYAQKLMRSSAEEIERLDADAAGAQAELASVKACWAEALENVATRNREIEQLRQERHQLRNELTAAGLEGDRLRSSFKNFHRLLCERFEYGHDEVDWERDQLSLIEWIAKRASHEPGVAPVVSPSHSLIALHAGCLCEWCKNERAKSALKSNERRCVCGLAVIPEGELRVEIGPSTHRLAGPCFQTSSQRTNPLP